MKKFLSLLGFLLVLGSGSMQAQISLDPSVARQQTCEANTVFIKHPAAQNPDAYFSEAGMLQFEIYKCGTKTQLEQSLAKLRSDKAVESCTEGVVTGDFQAVSVSLKSPQSKAWFVNWMRSAGFKTIKINNNAPVVLEKL